MVRLRDKLLTFSFLQWRTLEKNGEREGGRDAGREGKGREVRQAGKEEGGGGRKAEKKGKEGGRLWDKLLTCSFLLWRTLEKRVGRKTGREG